MAQIPSELIAAEIAARLGLRRYRRSWRGRCPACDYADTFSVREGRHRRALIYCHNCHDPAALAAAVACETGHECRLDPRSDADAAAVRQRKQDLALRLWSGSVPAAGTPADAYLTARGLPGLAASPALRFRGDTPHPEGGRYPALIALVSDVFDTQIGVHRTFITNDGRKAGVEPTKASLWPIWGGAIRLQPIAADKALVIGEGIESAASAGRLMGFPAWAAVSAGNMARGLLLPSEARWLVIAADPDDAGRAAARNAWLRWNAERRDVRIATPDAKGQDFNDLLLAQGVA